MFKTRFKPHFILILLLTGFVYSWSIPAMAQAPGEPDSPGYIGDLVDQTELTQDQVEQMRSDGFGWGNIMISARLAEQIAANSPEGAKISFDEALVIVIDARAEGKGFGQIAHENDLKVGRGDGDDETPDGTNQPPFIGMLVDKTELTIEQVEQMRSDGLGWGNITIATRLAERLVADSAEPLSFEDALDGVLEARAEGKGFGEIANENDLKLGRVVAKGKAQTTAGSQASVGRAAVKPKKQGFFGRLMSLFRLGRGEKPERPLKAKPAKIEKPERPEKPEKPEKPERPERPEKLERPAKPEKPERGPRR